MGWRREENFLFFPNLQNFPFHMLIFTTFNIKMYSCQHGFLFCVTLHPDLHLNPRCYFLELHVLLLVHVSEKNFTDKFGCKVLDWKDDVVTNSMCPFASLYPIYLKEEHCQIHTVHDGYRAMECGSACSGKASTQLISMQMSLSVTDSVKSSKHHTMERFVVILNHQSIIICSKYDFSQLASSGALDFMLTS